MPDVMMMMMIFADDHINFQYIIDFLTIFGPLKCSYFKDSNLWWKK